MLDALNNGAPKQDSFNGHASEFQGQMALAAFAMTPTTGKDAALQYKAKIEQLKAKVSDIVGLVPEVVSYM